MKKKKMSQSSRSRHTPSLGRALLMLSSSLTDMRPVIIWQTRDQREKRDLVGLTGTGGERSKETQERRRESGAGDERKDDRTKTEYQTTSVRYKSGREESPPGRRRGQSCSRIRRSYSRGRSRSPRRAGEPGPGILKGRSATHDGRKREGSLEWKMFRFNRVEEVREFSPWPEERLSHHCVGEDDEGQGNGVEKVDDDEKKVYKNECSVEVTITPTGRVAKIIKRQNLNEPRVMVGGGEKGKLVLKAIEDITKDSVYEETLAGEEHDANNNDMITSDEPLNATEEVSLFHGFGPDPLLPVVAKYDALIEEVDSEDTSQAAAGLLEVKFGEYQSRPVQCVYEDCQATSLPSTLGLLPLPQSGHQWLCATHSHCLLCPDPTSTTTSVRCTMCARLYHTFHLQLEEFQDRLDRELYICKLCTDPGQFTQHGGEQGGQAGDDTSGQAVCRGSSSLPEKRLPSNLHPSPAKLYQDQAQDTQLCTGRQPFGPFSSFSRNQNCTLL
jgi:hypothetical protein